MTRRERLLATLAGRPVDRPPVSFYELNGLDENPDNPDPFNIFNHPSWRPLIELTARRTDRIVMRDAVFQSNLPDPLELLADVRTEIHEGRRYTRKTLRAGNRLLTASTRRDPAVNTVWTEEHFLKAPDDLKALLDLPWTIPSVTPDPAPVFSAEAALGDAGIVMLDTPDPLCLAASLFDMAEFTVVAMTEPFLFHRLLERFAEAILPRVAAMSKLCPQRLWRIYGPEYAAAPYLPPALFRDYVVRYDRPMIEAIHRHGGYARVHCHGRVRDILDDIVGMGADGLDPIEPPPQGDIELAEIRRRHGRQLTLFGNLEIADIENLPSGRFAEKVRRALNEGTASEGRGFVLMPSACPYGRELSALTLKNYETMVDLVDSR